MKEWTVYVNGSMLPESQATISVFDRGFLYGDAAYDTVRTFNHVPFKLKEHIDRLYRSLKYLRIELSMTKKEMEDATLSVFQANEHLLDEEDDCAIYQRVSRGVTPWADILYPAKPTVVIYCIPIPFEKIATGYSNGVTLRTTSTRRTPHQCIDSRGKIQNKVNHILADLEAKQSDASSLPLMLDIQGYVSESYAANFFTVANGELATPGVENCLAGITRATTIDLAGELDLKVKEGNLTLYDVYNADEAFLTSTSYCIMPVTHVDGQKIGEGKPGPITEKLLSAWNKLAGIDILAQAMRHYNMKV